MSGDYPGIVRGIEEYSGVNMPGVMGTHWRMNLEFWAGGWKRKNEPDSFIELVKFVITEVYPDGIDLKTADAIWMKVQKMPMW